MRKKLCCILTILCIGLLSTLTSAAPLAQNGRIDLSSWNFKSEGPAALDGNWEFYWDRLYTPDRFQKKPQPEMNSTFYIPECWNEGYELNGETLDGKGMATFRLTVLGLPAGEQMAFQVPLMNTAYRLWANGRLISSNGRVGDSADISVPEFMPKTVVFGETSGQIELVLQISNFHHYNGGIWKSIRLGRVEGVFGEAQRQTAIDLFMIGAILIMALYHFGLFALRPNEVSPLFFGLFCLVVAFRIAIKGSAIFSDFFPGVSWELLLKLDYFTLFFGLPYYCAFINSLYPVEFSRRILNVIIVISVIYIAFTLLTPATIYPAYLSYYQIIMVLSSLYTLYALVRATINKREGARGVLAGCLIIIVTLVNDILYNQEIIHTGEFVGFGLLIMIFFQSYVLSAKFSKAFALVEQLSVHLDHLVKERTAAIKDLLDNTGQGFFSFANDFRIQEYTSRATTEFFGHAIENKNALELLYPESAEDKAEVFKLVFEQTGNLELVEGILPSEVKRGDRIYRVDYHWIKPRENSEGRVMIVMTDITTQRGLELQLKSDEERNQMIVKIAVDRSGFIEFLNETDHCLAFVEEQLSNSPAEIDVTALFRQFHTIKGGMASYFFMDVSEKAHHIENLLDTIRSDGAVPGENLIESLQEETRQLKEILQATLDSLEDIVPKQLVKAGFQPFYKISDSKISALERLLKDELSAQPEVRSALTNLRKQPVRNILKKLASDAENLAVKEGKRIKVGLKGEEIELLHSVYKPLFASLIHLIRNCVDHGIEDPDSRLAFDKSEIGHIAIRVGLDRDQLVIDIFDDGAGIDTEAVKQKAFEKGLLDAAKLASISDSEAVRLIFHPGFSTAEAVSDLSGRGVGMDAVSDEVTKLGGQIEVESTVGKGTCFSIRVPNL